ncbi:hypothetical protein SISSUDRAFT_376070 [Sistotremastrum suecicum HHB10207 ss-3]|uniref:Aminoglycoside phosphotransferase domain-containing protein n=1 Tax=Sistotremastrum suecicum HHB10207 ss-3 TaxID=1314776 RepID=A0A165Z308_9AGAM|nr:hypothetical protein SISSUDRAFT_376070 [Sistotremastrum suecicum HHB10207 ss-3]
MLQRVYALACGDGDAAPHVPRPIHCFERSPALVYLVMDHIEQVDVPKAELVEKAASVVQWLRSKRFSVEEPFGLMPDFPVYHKLFRWRRAPLTFTDVAAAERWFNVVLRKIRRSREPLAEISFITEEVVLTQSDMHASNFGVASDGRGILYDAASIGGFPLSLANFTLLRTTPFAAAVAQHIFDPEESAQLLTSPNMKSLVAVRKQLTWTFDDRFGTCGGMLFDRAQFLSLIFVLTP